MNLEQYLQGQLSEIAAAMFPKGLPGGFGGPQHRDIVRLFLAGGLVMTDKTAGEATDMDRLVSDACEEDWAPGSDWNWPIGEG